MVQNVIMPSIQSSSERIRYAPQIATANVAIWATVGSSSGRKISVSTAAIGIQSTITTTFHPAKKPRS